MLARLVKGAFYAVTIPFCCSWLMVVMMSVLQVVAGEDLATKLASQPVDPKCQNFSKGLKQTEEGGEFVSPNYPNNYFNNTECSLTLIAPPSHIIEIDFRERFQIERSTNCQHDYLEVFDGLGGHRQRLSRLCGMEFPKDRIFSSGRFLYLRFKSDDTAEYGGFKAVFFYRVRTEKVAPLRESCEQTESGFEGIIGTDNFTEQFREYSLQGNEINCLWVINVTKGYKVSLYFWKFDLSFPNNCEKNFLSIYGNRLDDEHRKHKFCGTQAKNASYEEIPLYLYLFASPLQGSFSQFQLHYSIYRAITTNEECTDQEFDCEDFSCVDKSLRCNGRQNCKYQTDEENCSIVDKQLFLFQEKVLVILVIGLLLLLSLAIAMVISCRRQWKELKKRRDEMASRCSVPAGLSHLDPDHTDINVALNDIDEGCYVPEIDLSIFQKRSNGGSAIAYDQETALGRMDPYHLSCSSNNSTPPPPPPPLYRNSVDGAHTLRTQQMSTFVMDDEGDEAADIFPPPPAIRQPDFANRRFRSKAIIQMEAERPQSFESTKSAPDVIGRH